MIEFLSQPWPWYISGPLIGIMVPALLLVGNKAFGISSSLRHICAACLPANIPFFKYDWKKERWNLFFVMGILLGGVVSVALLPPVVHLQIDPKVAADLYVQGITNQEGLVPEQLFGWQHLFSLRNLLMLVGGGFMIGFGSRYAGGCTGGHAIFGLSTLQLPSLIATCCFMIGGFAMTHLVLPYILSL
ncbi:MAG: YeeE/YedE family protein [Crocinitomicaceae bacterium]|nr:YeeE/YedE family protein [Crocinitomicaceae bacterium]